MKLNFKVQLPHQDLNSSNVDVENPKFECEVVPDTAEVTANKAQLVGKEAVHPIDVLESPLTDQMARLSQLCKNMNNELEVTQLWATYLKPQNLVVLEEEKARFETLADRLESILEEHQREVRRTEAEAVLDPELASKEQLWSQLKTWKLKCVDLQSKAKLDETLKDFFNALRDQNHRLVNQQGLLESNCMALKSKLDSTLVLMGETPENVQDTIERLRMQTVVQQQQSEPFFKANYEQAVDQLKKMQLRFRRVESELADTVSVNEHLKETLTQALNYEKAMASQKVQLKELQDRLLEATEDNAKLTEKARVLKDKHDELVEALNKNSKIRSRIQLHAEQLEKALTSATEKNHKLIERLKSYDGQGSGGFEEVTETKTAEEQFGSDMGEALDREDQLVQQCLDLEAELKATVEELLFRQRENDALKMTLNKKTDDLCLMEGSVLAKDKALLETTLQLEKAKASLDKADTQLAKLKPQNAQLKSDIDRMAERVALAEDQSQRLRDQNDRLSKQKVLGEEDLLKGKGECAELKRAIRALEKELAELKDKKGLVSLSKGGRTESSPGSDPHGLAGEVERLKSELERSKEALNDKEGQLRREVESGKDLDRECRQLRRELDQKTEEGKGVKAAMERVQGLLNQADQRLKEGVLEQDKLRREVEELKRALRDALAESERLGKHNGGLAAELAGLKSELLFSEGRAKSAADRLAGRCKELQGQVEGLESESANLHKLVEQLRDEVHQLGLERDGLRGALKDKTEQVEELDRLVGQLREEMQSLKGQSGSGVGKKGSFGGSAVRGGVGSDGRELWAIESENEVLRNKAKALQAEVDSMQKQLLEGGRGQGRGRQQERLTGEGSAEGWEQEREMLMEQIQALEDCLANPSTTAMSSVTVKRTNRLVKGGEGAVRDGEAESDSLKEENEYLKEQLDRWREKHGRLVERLIGLERGDYVLLTDEVRRRLEGFVGLETQLESEKAVNGQLRADAEKAKGDFLELHKMTKALMDSTSGGTISLKEHWEALRKAQRECGVVREEKELLARRVEALEQDLAGLAGLLGKLRQEAELQLSEAKGEFRNREALLEGRLDKKRLKVRTLKSAEEKKSQSGDGVELGVWRDRAVTAEMNCQVLGSRLEAIESERARLKADGDLAMEQLERTHKDRLAELVADNERLAEEKARLEANRAREEQVGAERGMQSGLQEEVSRLERLNRELTMAKCRLEEEKLKGESKCLTLGMSGRVSGIDLELAKDQLRKSRNEADQLRSLLAAKDSQFRKKKEKVDSLKAQLVKETSGSDPESMLRKALAESEDSRLKTESELAGLKADAQGLMDRQAKDQMKAIESQERVMVQGMEVADLKGEVAVLGARLKQAEERLKEAEAVTEGLGKEVVQLKGALESSEALNEDLKRQLSRSAAPGEALKELQGRLERSEQTVAKQKQDIFDLREQLKGKDWELGSSGKEGARKGDDSTEGQSGSAKAQSEVKALKGELAKARKAVDAAQAVADRLKLANDDLANRLRQVSSENEVNRNAAESAKRELLLTEKALEGWRRQVEECMGENEVMAKELGKGRGESRTGSDSGSGVVDQRLRRLQELEVELSEGKVLQADLGFQVERLQRELAGYAKAIEEMRRADEESQKEVLALQGRLRGALGEAERAKDQLGQMSGALGVVQGQLSEEQELAGKLRDQLGEAERLLREKERQLEGAKEGTEVLVRQLRLVQQWRQEAQGRADRAEEELNQAKGVDGHSKARENELQLRLAGLGGQVDQLQKEVEALKDSLKGEMLCGDQKDQAINGMRLEVVGWKRKAMEQEYRNKFLEEHNKLLQANNGRLKSELAGQGEEVLRLRASVARLEEMLRKAEGGPKQSGMPCFYSNVIDDTSQGPPIDSALDALTVNELLDAQRLKGRLQLVEDRCASWERLASLRQQEVRDLKTDNKREKADNTRLTGANEGLSRQLREAKERLEQLAGMEYGVGDGQGTGESGSGDWGKRLQEALVSLAAECRALQGEKAGLVSELGVSGRRAVAAEAEIQRLRAEVQGLGQSVGEVEEEKSRLKKRLAEAEQSGMAESAKCQFLKSELDKLREWQSSWTAKRVGSGVSDSASSALKEEVAYLTQTGSAKDSQLERMAKELAEAESHLEQLRKVVQALRSERDGLMDGLTQKTKANDFLVFENGTLREYIDMLLDRLKRQGGSGGESFMSETRVETQGAEESEGGEWSGEEEVKRLKERVGSLLVGGQRDQVLWEEVARLEEELQKSRGEVDRLKGEALDGAGRLQSREEATARLKEQFEGHGRQQHGTEGGGGEGKAEVSRLKTKLQLTEESVRTLETRLANQSKNPRVAELELERQAIDRLVANLKDRLRKSREAVEGLEEEGRSKDQRVGELEGGLSEARSALAAMQERLSKLQGERRQWEADRAKLGWEVEGLAGRVRQLESEAQVRSHELRVQAEAIGRLGTGSKQVGQTMVSVEGSQVGLNQVSSSGDHLELDDGLKHSLAKLGSLSMENVLLRNRLAEALSGAELVSACLNETNGKVKVLQAELAHWAERGEESQRLVEAKEALIGRLESAAKVAEAKTKALEEELDARARQIGSLKAEWNSQVVKWQSSVQSTTKNEVRVVSASQAVTVGDPSDPIHEELLRSITVLTGELRSKEAEWRQAVGEVDRLTRKDKANASRVSELSVEGSQLKERLAKADSRVVELSAEVSGLRDKLFKADSRVSELSMEVSQLKEKLAKADLKINELNTEVSQLKQKLARADSKVSELGEEVRGLREKLAGRTRECPS
jgi:chromosome segregation ATPase